VSHQWVLASDLDGGTRPGFTWAPPRPGCYPVVGDWNGDGTWEPGFYEAATGTWSLSSQIAPAAISISFELGNAGYVPVVGDWTGGGRSLPGLYSPSTHTWALFDGLSSTASATVFVDPAARNGDIPIAGVWGGSKHWRPGYFRPVERAFHLARGELDAGYERRGWPGDGGADLPLVGWWDGPSVWGVGVFDVRSLEVELVFRAELPELRIDARFGFGQRGAYAVPGSSAIFP
jgi:hypothetical protein